MGGIKKLLCWKRFSGIYMYVSIIVGALLIQASTLLGIYIMVHGVIIGNYPIEEEPKLGRCIAKGMCCFSLIALIVAGVLASGYLISGVLTLLKIPL